MCDIFWKELGSSAQSKLSTLEIFGLCCASARCTWETWLALRLQPSILAEIMSPKWMAKMHKMRKMHNMRSMHRWCLGAALWRSAMWESSVSSQRRRMLPLWAFGVFDNCWNSEKSRLRLAGLCRWRFEWKRVPHHPGWNWRLSSQERTLRSSTCHGRSL